MYDVLCWPEDRRPQTGRGKTDSEYHGYFDRSSWEDDESLESMNYIEIEVTDQYKTLATQLKVRNIDFYLKLTIARKFVVIRYYTIRLGRQKRSAWSRFAEHSIPYQHPCQTIIKLYSSCLGAGFCLLRPSSP